ncbi:XRE family transcriptional regulator [Streptomyces sp. RFCAC02]|uniref:helix-turn-helix domain-containing protein n=1 Tax=Streptomyces sp. RFCAC02 TaxID=2499143 RepID=UPI00102250B9|nr:XRE family transcriptional regulator [Streptomyces sp. RFCAC02]
MESVHLNETIAAALRRERTRAGITLTELARRAGLAKSTLSQLESGGGNPSVETLWALAGALGVPFSRLVDPPGAAVRLVRADEGTPHHADDADYSATLLAAAPPHVRRDIYRIAAEPGDTHHSEPHQPGTVEHLVIGSGRAEAGPADEPVELGPGDYLAYPGDAPHVFRALLPGTTGVIAMDHS